ncbi:MAG: VWA domain-containing protein, partial [Defluviitaleaceae bacterium]|nr:VWA domain-containing protein [Defluviitaleaceae bacterium]
MKTVDPVVRFLAKLLSAGLLAVLLLGLLVFWAKIAFAYETQNDCTYDCDLFSLSAGLVPIDAVLVLDVSRSMRTADPQRISRDAMNLFIEMLSEGRDRVGVVAYAGQVERSRAMTTIRGQDCRDSFGSFINELNYASWTDHGLGLMEAVRIMYDGHSGYDKSRQPAIILLTDGNLNVNPASPRSNAIAQQDVETAISIAQEMGSPIYTIGLNFDGRLDIAYISKIAEATGGLVFET